MSPKTLETMRRTALTVCGGLTTFGAMAATGALGDDLRTALVAASVLLVAAHVSDRPRRLAWTVPYLALAATFGVFHDALGSSPSLLVVPVMGAAAYALGRSVGPTTARWLAVPLAAVGYVAQVNATALTSRATGAAVDVAAIEVARGDERRPLLVDAEPNTVFEFWNETCAPCLRNLRDLGAYRGDYTIVPVYVPFFDSEPMDAAEYVDYPVRRQAVLATPWEQAGIGGVPLAVVVGGEGEVCFQGILRDRPLDLVGGTRAVLGLWC